eukprot:TRINITY_DN36458_c0_g1_i1.p2 TRINITY_DN36458_c0_g1~~TRINITY_DN36458_c0_g1_i1.p2  ORF type:complete len:118 (-),score=24.28 TRINITY_DN36458_c0_g1_i1:86-439(-)
MFGFDFMLDQEFSPWLLEANTSPQTSSDAPMLQAAADQALTELMHLVLCKHHGSECGRCPEEQASGARWVPLEKSQKIQRNELQRMWLHKKAAQAVPSVAGLRALVREYLTRDVCSK